MRSLKLLAVFAHPDDESFAAGGTLAKYAAEGVEVVIVSATKGEAGIEGLTAAETAAIREGELRAAAAELGVSEVCFLGYLDATLSGVDQPEAVARVAGLLREVDPEAVITFGPDGISGHPDHVAISRWVTAAVDALDGSEVLRRLYYVVPSLATKQGCQVGDPPPLPKEAIGIDVSAHLETKVRAMQAHASQEPPYPGDPAQEAHRLTSHEWFVLARVLSSSDNGPEADLLAGMR